MTRDRVDLRRLHFINALFGHATGHDLYLAEQIKGAITFSLAELAAHLPRRGFFHWDAALTPAPATPLFARAELMAGLRLLAPYRESTLLVTNLRPALIPPQKRSTARRRRDYEEALAFIRDLTAARTTRHADLQLLFL